jgi:Rod binding domain-containing protein
MGAVMGAVMGPGAVTGGQSDAAAGVPSPQLAHAAHEFEAQMMKEMLKPMTSAGNLNGDEADEDGSMGALGEYGTEALGMAISNQGGFGIARGILRDLSRSGNHPAASAVTGNDHDNTVSDPQIGLKSWRESTIAQARSTLYGDSQ